MNKKHIFTLLATLLIGFAVGATYGGFLTKYLKEKFENISFIDTPEIAGYKGTAKVEAIRAHLYYDHNGTISGDIFAKKDITLWNTIIGEGDAASSSETTFVIVEISGRDISSTRNAKVNIVATNSKGDQIANETRNFSIYANYRKSYIPLLIPDTGCDHVTVTAKLVGKGFDMSSISQTIPFECGE